MPSQDLPGPLMHRALAAVLTVGIERPIEPPALPLGPHVWRALVDTVIVDRLMGLLGASVDAGFPVTDEQAAEVTDLRREAAVLAARLEDTLLAVHDALVAAGVEHRVLKGLATGRVLYPSPAWRDSGDVDLWVRPTHAEAAARVIEGLGAAPRPAVLGPALPDATMMGRSTFDLRSGLEVDVHARLLYGWPEVPDSAFDHVVTVDVAGRSLAVLDVEGMAVHAAAHHAVGSRRSTEADLVRLLGPNLALRDRFGDELSPVTAAAVVDAFDDVRHWMPGLTLPDEGWLRHRARRPSARIGRRLQRLPPLRFYLGPLVRGDAPTTIRALRQVVLPDRELLDQRGMTLRRHYRRIAGRLAHLDQPGQPYAPPAG